jgi:hypothetical protein
MSFIFDTLSRIAPGTAFAPPEIPRPRTLRHDGHPMLGGEAHDFLDVLRGGGSDQGDRALSRTEQSFVAGECASTTSGSVVREPGLRRDRRGSASGDRVGDGEAGGGAAEPVACDCVRACARIRGGGKVRHSCSSDRWRRRHGRQVTVVAPFVATGRCLCPISASAPGYRELGAALRTRVTMPAADAGGASGAREPRSSRRGDARRGRRRRRKRLVQGASQICNRARFDVCALA